MKNRTLIFLVILSLCVSILRDQQIDIEVQNANTPGIQIKHLRSDLATSINLLNDDNKIFDIGITGSQNTFFGSKNTAYLFTTATDGVPIVFGTGGKERMRLTPAGTLTLGRPASQNLLYNAALWVSPESFNRGIFIDIDHPGQPNNAMFVDCNSLSEAIYIIARGIGGGINVKTENGNALRAVNNSSDPSIVGINDNDGPAAQFETTDTNSTNSTLECINSGNGHAISVFGTAFKSDGNQNWTIASDRRLKKNIQPFQDGLEVLTKINPVSYQYNGLCGTKEGQESIGIIAQEILEVAPYMIEEMSMKTFLNDTNDEEKIEDLLTYNSSVLPYIMVNAIQELSKLVEEQNDFISAQKQINEEQSKEIETLKSKFKAFKTSMDSKYSTLASDKVYQTYTNN